MAEEEKVQQTEISAQAGKEVALSVRNLSISFYTDHGRVHAVRGVSFDLYKGETLCIVGESGSGKSVTSKTIMGILPNNAHIDGGYVMYEGEDLTKIAEDDFHRIRGNKIGMIFQDPLSSLNPIMKVGKQVTEAMLINGSHVKRMYNDLISQDLVRYKNDLRLFEIEKEELAFAKKEAKKTKNDKTDDAAYAEAKAKFVAKKSEYKAKFSDDKAKLAITKKEARSKVKEFIKGVAKDYIANALPFLWKSLKDLIHFRSPKDNWGNFIAARRFYLSKLWLSRKSAKEKALKVMAEVGIPQPERRFYQYPFEFSGGMRQRIVIAIALVSEPDILICDEPTTALDVTIQAQILELINRLKAAHDMSVIFITHDLGVVAEMADRVAVMYAGKIVEYGTSLDVFYHPAHPYTWALLSSIPDIDSKERLEAIPGTPPDMIYPPKGDAFALRSKYAMGIDFEEEPPMFKISESHYAATWLLDSRAPSAVMPKIVSTRIANSLKKAGKEDI
jgi:oligopeptide transport system ATP-binding protein